MFLHELSGPQKRAFITLARRFVSVDGEYTEGEEELFGTMLAEMGLELSDGREGEFGELVESFDTREAKVSALLEIIGLGFADGDFGPDENNFVNQIANAFEIDEEEIPLMENWVRRQLALADEAESLLSG